jgi:hypothetical protein
MAVATNAIILPFSAIGAAESFDVLLDSNEQLSIPVLGNILKRKSDAIPGEHSRKIASIQMAFSIAFFPQEILQHLTHTLTW